MSYLRRSRHQSLEQQVTNATVRSKIRPVISAFEGRNAFLSNFFASPVYYEEFWYPTVEHAYQAAKSLDPEDRRVIRMQRTAALAKRAGQKVLKRPDWEDIKIDVMTGLLFKKFEKDPLRKMLRDTHGSDLVEGNWWGDTYWGICNGIGENHLGRILMAVRKTTRERIDP